MEKVKNMIPVWNFTKEIKTTKNKMISLQMKTTKSEMNSFYEINRRLDNS